MKLILVVTVAIITFMSCNKVNPISESTTAAMTVQTDFGEKRITVSHTGSYIVTFTETEFKEVIRNFEKKENSGSQATGRMDLDGTSDIDPKFKEGGIKVKIKIGAKKYNCKKGVGFRCGGSVGPYTKIELRPRNPSSHRSIENGRNLDRLYLGEIKWVNNNYQIEFLEHVDWKWLEETES